MVRILASGEVVQDDDPRLRNQPRQRPGRINTLQHDDDDEQYGAQGHGEGRGSGILEFFNNLNQKLLEAGVPRWNAGPYVVEPIVSVGFLIAGLLIGIRGLIFGAILFFVSKYSMSNQRTGHNQHPGPQQGPQGPRRPGPGRPGPGGHRLGRS